MSPKKSRSRWSQDPDSYRDAQQVRTALERLQPGLVAEPKLRLLIWSILFNHPDSNARIRAVAARLDLDPLAVTRFQQGACLEFDRNTTHSLIAACTGNPALLDAAMTLYDEAVHNRRRTPAAHSNLPYRWPEPEKAQTMKELSVELKVYRLTKGNPSYEKMQAAIGGKGGSSSTFSRMICDGIITAISLEAFVRACGGTDEEVDRFHQAFVRIRSARR